MLNPSTADARNNDPTIRRCMSLAQGWGYGSLAVVNLFAFRATRPDVLKQAADPVGPRNNRWIARLVDEADLIVAAANPLIIVQLREVSPEVDASRLLSCQCRADHREPGRRRG